MPKKKTALTIEERLQQALVPAEEQPYEVPENWVWVRLGAVCSFENGYAFKSDNFSNEKGIPIIRISNIKDNNVDLDDCIKTLEENIDEKFIVHQGDLLIAMSGATTGKNGVYMSANIAYLNQRVGNIKVRNKELLSDKFRNFYIANMQNEILNTAYGGAQPNISSQKMSALFFPLPPLSEQQRIVERIEELFAKLDEAKERLQEVADSFAVRKAAILHKAFTGELTKQWRRENGVSDESWEEKKGEDFFEYVTSGSRGWAKYYSDKGSIFVRMGNLNHGTIELDFSDIQYVELPDQVEGQRSKLQKNDILISITADVGMIGLVREDMDAYINQHVALARPKNDLYAEFLAWYFVSDVGLQQMQNKQRGATKIGLGLQDIRSIILKIPTLPEQHEIVRLIDDLLARERAAQQATEQALASIDLMKKSILARAFRGELGTNKASEASALELLRQVLAEN